MEVLLTTQLEQFVQRLVENGKYASASDVILAAVTLLEAREHLYQGRFEALQQDVLLGVEQLDRGDRLDGSLVIEQLRQKNRVQRQSSQ